MFFTPELLAKRDSGFGLLWLAATLGSKSTFKKLPKRSVLTADISQLCDLIAEPAEPLALRLSSNLMVGVARVYKVKQEIFMSDVTTCFNNLKKVVQDLRSTSLTEAQLQMAQPSVKASALTLTADPRMAFAVDFDNLVADWDEFLGIGGNENENEADDFNPKSKKPKQKGKARASATENLRADLHTLKENHEYLLSASFDASINHSGNLAMPSSSQIDAGFGYGFDDNFFGMSDGLELGGDIGDELARELGEGWGAAPDMPMADHDMITDEGVDLGLDVAMDMYADNDFQLPDGAFGGVPSSPSNLLSSVRKTGKTNKQVLDKENMPPAFSRASSLTARVAMTPIPFSQQLLEQDSEIPLPEEPAELKRPLKKTKRVRLLLDPRTELTDEELKTARAQYLQDQIALRTSISQKKIEKDSGKIMEKLMWGVPTGLQAQALADFWLDNYKIQVEARSGALQLDIEDEPPKKRRKTRDTNWEDEGLQFNDGYAMSDLGMNVGMDMDTGMYGGDFGVDDMMHGSAQLRSSEEPGQGRLGSSRPQSIRGSNFGLDFGQQNSQGASQRSALFPWDHAGDVGVSSSVDGAAFGFGNEEFGLDQVEVRLRGSSASVRSGRASSQLMSRMGSLGEPGSPLNPGDNFQLEDDNFAFEVPANNSATFESQRSDLINLERNSFNFLEYAKMQYQSLPGPNASLTFEDVVPKASSNAHIASSALYHCLVLGTKDLARFDQPEAYGPIKITIKT